MQVLLRRYKERLLGDPSETSDLTDSRIILHMIREDERIGMTLTVHVVGISVAGSNPDCDRLHSTFTSASRLHWYIRRLLS